MGITNLVGGDDGRPERTMSIEGFAQHPLGGFPLPISHRKVVTDRVAEDMSGSLFSADVTTSLTDHGHQFDFVIEFIRDDRKLDVTVRIIDGCRLLAKPDLLSRNGEARVLGFL